MVQTDKVYSGDFWIKIILTCSWLPVLFYTLGNYILVSLTLHLTAIAICFWALAILIKNRSCRRSVCFHCLVMICIFAGMCLTIENADDRRIRSLLFFLTIVATFVILEETSFSKKEVIKYNFHLILAITIIMGLRALWPSSYDGNQYKNRLYLGFQNPNVLSGVLLLMFVYTLIYIVKLKKKSVGGAVLGINSVLMFLTQSRTGIFVEGLVLLLLYISTVKVHYNGTTKKIISALIISLPLLVVAFSNVIESITSISFLQLNGRGGLSGRLSIWIESWKHWMHSPDLIFLGQTNQAMYKLLDMEVLNTHNCYLQWLYNYGIVGFLCIVWWIGKLLFNSLHNSELSKIILISFFAIMLNNCFETGMADGIIGMTFCSLLILKLG